MTLTSADRRYARREASDARYQERLAERATAAAAALEAARRDGLPELVGSDAQVAWAVRIRAEALEAFSGRLSRAGDGRTFATYEAAMVGCQSETLAAVWIAWCKREPVPAADGIGGESWTETLVREWIGRAIAMGQALEVLPQ